MKNVDFNSKVKNHLINYKENNLGIYENGIYNHKGTIIMDHKHILLNLLDNFLPMAKVDYLFWGLPAEKIVLHKFAHHLNSSQVMCINFFAPLIKSMTGQELLCEILKDTEILPRSTELKITEATFEKVINLNEGTNFDFFLKFTSGEQLFFEIKYTEDGFGKIHPSTANPSKYDDKWDEIYKSHLNNSLLIKDMDKDIFYRNYQIWRNVSYVKNDKDYTIFLYPFDNEKAHQDISETIKGKEIYKKNVKYIDWKFFVNSALKLSKDSEFQNHFEEFYKKYLSY